MKVVVWQPTPIKQRAKNDHSLSYSTVTKPVGNLRTLDSNLLSCPLETMFLRQKCAFASLNLHTTLLGTCLPAEWEICNLQIIRDNVCTEKSSSVTRRLYLSIYYRLPTSTSWFLLLSSFVYNAINLHIFFLKCVKTYKTSCKKTKTPLLSITNFLERPLSGLQPNLSHSQ